MSQPAHGVLTRIGISVGVLRPVPQSRRVRVTHENAGPAGSAIAPAGPASRSAPQAAGARVQAGTPAPARAPVPASVSPSAPPATQRPEDLLTAEARSMQERLFRQDIQTVFPPKMRFQGDLEFEDSVVLECAVTGNVTQRGDHSLVIGQQGAVHGNVTAKTVIVCGHIVGDVLADTVVVRAGGVITGNVIYEKLMVFNGEVNGVMRHRSTQDAQVPAEASPAAGDATPALRAVSSPRIAIDDA